MPEQFLTSAAALADTPGGTPDCTLDGGINDSTTTIVLHALPAGVVDGSSNTFVLRFGSELMRVTAVSTLTLTVTRGYGPSDPAAHADDAEGFLVWTGEMLENAIGLSLISSTIVGAGGAASVTISSIPATYKHLLLVITARSDAAGVTNVECRVQLNGDTGANYAWASLIGSGAAASSTAGNDQTSMAIGLIAAATATASHAGTIQATIFDYARTAWFKHVNGVGQWSIEDGSQPREYRGIWESTAAITSVTVIPVSGNLVEHSRVGLWGMR
jgi:hypothetical protein